MAKLKSFSFLLRLAFWGWKRILRRGSFICKFGKWMSHVSTTGTQTALVLFTLDRCLSVCAPYMYKTQLKTNLRYPVVAIGVGYLVMGLLNGGHFLIYHLQDGFCLSGSEPLTIWGEIYFHYHFTFLQCAAPALAMFVFNVMIILKLRSTPP